MRSQLSPIGTAYSVASPSSITEIRHQKSVSLSPNTALSLRLQVSVHSFTTIIPVLTGYYLIIGLFVMAFTTYKQVHWIAPIIGSIPFGAGIYFIFTGVFTYLVTAYRPIAASAMAANSAMRSSFAAVFPLFAGQMYDRLGTVGATALLAGLLTLMTPLP